MTPLDAWLAGQPLSVRTLAREFPYGTRVDGVGPFPGWVVSWSADLELELSSVEPGPEWLRAKIERVRFVAASLVRRGKR